MKSTGNKSEAAAVLRQKAEELLKKQRSKIGSKLSETDAFKLIHELEVHQIELEMQNEELILARTAATESAEKYLELYDFAPSGFFTLSREGKIIDLNLYGYQMLGRERLFLKNSQFGFFVSDDTKTIFNLFLTKVFESKSKESCEVTLTDSNNGLMYVHLTGMTTGNGEQCLVTVIDITERRLAENEIKLKNEELIKLNAEKDKFFSIIAHDLRSPLVSFLGLTEIVTKQSSVLTKDKMQELVVDMRDSATNLFRLLENLLQWAKMHQELIKVNQKVVKLLPIVDESIETVMEAANNKGIEITYNIPDDFEVFSDVYILQTVIRNLVSNAVKFTPRGGEIHLSAKADDEKSVEMSIKDSGIGMSSSMIDNLFRLDVSTERDGTEGEPSTGLGLIICKDFLEKQGGKLWVESEVGKGSNFKFTLPHYI